MTESNSLGRGISQIAWGFVFILFHFRINSIDLLPDFVGYILAAIGIGSLAEALGHLKILKPLSIIISIWTASLWFTETLTLTSLPSVGYMSTVMGYLSISMRVAILIFTIILLTDLSVLAAKHQPEGKNPDRMLIVARNIYAVCYSVSIGLSLSALLTLNKIPEILTALTTALSLASGLAMLVAMILILFSLFSLKKIITENEAKSSDGTYAVPPFEAGSIPSYGFNVPPVSEEPQKAPENKEE